MNNTENLIDYWHYPRQGLAEQVLATFEHGLSSALIFFAPRRMGKTEFLRKDILPLAEKLGWQVCYFSFLDCAQEPTLPFTNALAELIFTERPKAKLWQKLADITKISAFGIAIERQTHITDADLKSLIRQLAEQPSKTLLLLDEIQALSHYKHNATFIASLRTALDMYKDKVKVIFTGSSQAGLRQMFSKAEAPFFHFGQNLLFPELDRGFTKHLATIFNQVTKQQIDEAKLWYLFQQWQFIPQLIRALVERLVLDPTLNLDQASFIIRSEFIDEKNYLNLWNECSELERLLLLNIVTKKTNLFAQETRQLWAKQLERENLAIPTVQSALRSLQRKALICKLSARGQYEIEDQYFANWLLKANLLAVESGEPAL